MASAKGYLAKKDLNAAIIELKNALQKQPDLAEARFLLGKTLLDYEDPVAAAVELREAQNLKYPDEQVLPVLADALLSSGHPGKVIELDSEAALKKPEAVAALKTTVARAQALQGNAEKAEVAVVEALNAKGTFAPALLLRARSIASKRDFDAAMKIVDDVIARSPDDTDALSLKGDIQFERKDVEGAKALYRKVLAAQPANIRASGALVAILLQQGDVQAARDQIEAMKKVRPNHLLTMYFRATLAAQSGDLKLAGELIQQLLKGAPENTLILQLAGAVALQRDDLSQAQQYLGKLVELIPQEPLARQMLASAHLRSGDPGRALAVLEPLLDATAPDAKTLALAGNASMISGDLKRAEDLLGRVTRLNPKDATSRTALAVTHIALGDVNGSMADLQAIASSDLGTTADLTLISVSANRRNFDAALKAIDQLEKKELGKPQVPHLRAQVLTLEGDRVGGRVNYEKALAADPNFFPSVDGLAALDLLDNKPEAARARFEAVLKARPDEVRAMLALADLDERAGKPKAEVVSRLTKAIATKPSDPLLRRRHIRYLVRTQDSDRRSTPRKKR